MNIQTVKLVYFSPTGTTKAIVQSIARGLKIKNVQTIDITKPNIRKAGLSTSSDELLVIGVPVYMGRVPELLDDWLCSLKADKTPTVCIVVYGNRAYENSLQELKDKVSKCGGKTIACGAYIGEHSFSTSEFPTAPNRPNPTDTEHAENFGNAIAEKLQLISTVDHISEVESPGSTPYNGITQLWDVDFISINESCTQCGLCSESCPVSAIDTIDCKLIDITKCLSCCACIKKCPQKARSIKPGPVHEATLRLSNLYNEYKDPEMYI